MRREEGSDKGVWPCGRVGAAGCCCGGGTHQQASQAPGHQQQDIWGTLLIGCNPKMGLRTFPNVRLVGTLPQEAQEADHRWDPPRLRIRLARLLPCSSSPSLDCLPRTCSSAPPVARALPRRDRQIHPGPACGTIAPELRSGHGGLLACCETRPLLPASSCSGSGRLPFFRVGNSVHCTLPSPVGPWSNQYLQTRGIAFPQGKRLVSLNKRSTASPFPIADISMPRPSRLGPGRDKQAARERRELMSERREGKCSWCSCSGITHRLDAGRDQQRHGDGPVFPGHHSKNQSHVGV